MAKKIKYKFLSCEVNRGTEEKPSIEQFFLEKSLTWNETNEEIAKTEAYQGVYTVEDDVQSESMETTDAVVNVLLGVRE